VTTPAPGDQDIGRQAGAGQRASVNIQLFNFYFDQKISKPILIKDIMDHLYENNSFLKLE